MYEYPVENPALHPIFDSDLPNSPALWAVLKGKHVGKALVDDRRNPSQCVLRTAAVLSYFGIQTTQAFLDEAITHFRKSGPVWLIWPHRSFLQPPTPQEATVVERMEFYEYDRYSDVLINLKKQIPDDFIIQNIDLQLLERCEWRSEIEFYTGSVSNFLKNGIGLCMMRGNEIVVEAYATAFGKTRAEIGAITREKYRGRGYAPIACAYLVEACEQRGYQAYWSCDRDNIASIRVAQKLGFHKERAYRIHEYDPIPS